MPASSKRRDTKFLDPVTRKIVTAWIQRERYDGIPWHPLSKPLPACTVAILSSGAISLKTEAPFDTQGEKNNPWWGDPSFRALPSDRSPADFRIDHLHIDTRPAMKDINCIWPKDRLRSLADQGKIGAVAPSHYSIMGYILQTEELLRDTTPEIVERLKKEEVDVTLLVPV